jgi:alpha,alpha-trehalose-phosphate synthase [UDP-forming]/trehalose-phosphatase
MRHPTPAPFAPDFWFDLVQRPRIALLLDLDGTLIPFAETAEQAQLDNAAIANLQALVDAGVQVTIVTGRTLPSAEMVRKVAPDIWWVAEHGLWQRFDGEWVGPEQRAPELDELISALGSVFEVPGARMERKTLGVCVHWRAVAAEHRESMITNAELICDEWLEANPEFERLEGVEMLEIRHRSATKASAVRMVRERIPDAHLLAIGDDETDEDMFAALREDELAIAVRNFRTRRTRARAWLSTPDAVHEFLRWIIEVRTTEIDREPPLEVAPPRHAAVRSRLVVVSNRAPAQVSADTRRRQVSGLVSALQPALDSHAGIWLGWSGRELDSKPELVVDDEALPTRASFDLRPSWRKHFYDGFCNRALWPLLHSFPSRVRYSDADWNAYVEVNDVYAKFAAELVEPDGTIWVHDYHLLLLARSLHEAGYRGPKGLFMHVPFPGPDVFETLPWCDEVLTAMRAFDLLGFHTPQWADNFAACLRAQDQRTGKAARVPTIGVMPIGIDPHDFVATEDTLDREVVGLRGSLGQRRLILGVDRLDYSKGIPERLQAFDRLLEDKPEWRGKVSFVQISVPTRVDVPEYAELRQQVEKLVGRINGRYGEADWVPVRYLYRSYDTKVLAQLYRTADVALVTPLRDGMNLVAKEFIAAQDASQPGVLVLSRFAGAAAELTDAILTNPYHPDGLAADLDRALRMPLEERRVRHALLAAKVRETSPQQWAASFMTQLRNAGTAAERQSVSKPRNVVPAGSSQISRV